MGKIGWIVCFCSCLCLIGFCWPARSLARQGLGSVEKVGGASRKGSHPNKRSGLKGRKRGRGRAAARQRGGAKRMKIAKGGEAASADTAGHAAVTDGQTLREEENDEYMEYRVKRGDTLEKLARRFGLETEEFTDLNGVSGKRLKPGSTVLIPKPEEGEEDAPIALNDRPLRPWKSEDERGILVKVAKSFAGAPYRYGGTSVRGLDCSAFVKKMYEIFEVQLPRSAREQFFAGPRVSKEDLIAGDLVFFRTRPFARYPTHVGIYIGDNCFIHASSLFGRGVKIDRLNGAYFARTFIGAVRIKGAPPLSESNDANQEQSKAQSNT